MKLGDRGGVAIKMMKMHNIVNIFRNMRMKRRMRELTKGKGRTNIMEERRESRENLIKAKENSRKAFKIKTILCTF